MDLYNTLWGRVSPGCVPAQGVSAKCQRPLMWHILGIYNDNHCEDCNHVKYVNCESHNNRAKKERKGLVVNPETISSFCKQLTLVPGVVF